MTGLELEERAAAEELEAIPRGPERYLANAEGVDPESVYALGRRVGRRVPKMLAQQGRGIGPVRVLPADFHSCTFCTLGLNFEKSVDLALIRQNVRGVKPDRN
jgi:hypothetical protein